jgi:glycosyltransferase involved in cell wall biosynthesis
VRILVVSDLYPPVAFGGYESETAGLVDGLRERHEVLVLTSDRGDAPPDPGVRRELPYVGPKQREALAAPAKAGRAVEIARATLDDFHPDLVYVANSVAIPQSAPLAAAATGVPMAYRLSELFMASSLYTGDRYLRTLLPGQRGLRGVWAGAMKAYNRRLGLQPSTPHRAGISWASNALREHVTPPHTIEPAIERTIHPATTQETAFSAIERAPADPPSVLFLGRMTTAKGIELAYRALATLRREHGIDARLVLVGTAKPEMVAALEELATELGVTDAIEDRGRLETEGLSQVLAEVGVLVLPTVEWDVFPLVLIEAGLARVPIVAARIGGVPEAVVHEEHALLFEPGDADGCAAALADVLRNPDAAATRAAHAYERMRGLSVARYREESERFVVETAEALS